MHAQHTALCLHVMNQGLHVLRDDFGCECAWPEHHAVAHIRQNTVLDVFKLAKHFAGDVRAKRCWLGQRCVRVLCSVGRLHMRGVDGAVPHLSIREFNIAGGLRSGLDRELAICTTHRRHVYTATLCH